MERQRKTTKKKCQKCGIDFVAKNKSAKFCSSNCRQEAYNDRKTSSRVNELKKEISESEETLLGLKVLASDKAETSQAELNKMFKEGKIEKDLFKAILTFQGQIIKKRFELKGLLQ